MKFQRNRGFIFSLFIAFNNKDISYNPESTPILSLINPEIKRIVLNIKYYYFDNKLLVE